MEFIETLLGTVAPFILLGVLALAVALNNRREARQQRATAHATSICGQCWVEGAIIPLCVDGATRHTACTRHAATTSPKEVA